MLAQNIRAGPNFHYGSVYEQDKYARIRIQKYANLIRSIENGTSRRSLLDIGCYTAELKKMLPDSIDYWGVDFDEVALTIARGVTDQLIVRHFDTEPLAIDRSFDIVVCAEVLEHLMDPHRMMRQICSLVAPGGHVLISLPNENMLYHRLMAVVGIGVDSHAFQLYKHVHLPTISQSRAFVSRYVRLIREDVYINPGARGSRVEALGQVFTKIPDAFWYKLARGAPGLFARGVIFLGRPISR